MSDFKDLNLSTQILSALIKKGYTTPTPIQLQSIPHLLEGKDLLGIAQTGTGKTAAFALPILDNLFKSGKSVQPNNVRALILTPTRELASQIVDNIKLYGHDLGLRSAVIFGGVNMNNQIRNTKQGFDILVATPGRLLDLINQGHLKFSQLEIFVLDEADRMLDMGFINDVKKIIAKLPKVRQTLFFSATMPKDVAVLADSILNNPAKVEITPQATTVEKIDQRVNFVEKANKPLLLKAIIESSDEQSLFLVFSKTKHGANRVVEFLEKQSIKVAAIHGNKSQSARERALDDFRQGKIKVLMATDIAARGIDIVGITHVINYDIPNHPESYVHRIGRTARAGREGIAISFCDNSESSLLRDIEKVIKLKLPVDESHPFHGVKASASAKSALDVRDRPKSGYRTTPKPSFTGERKPSYFAESRRWKDGDERQSKPKFEGAKFSGAKFDGAKFNGERKSGFGEERKPRADFRDSPKPRFGASSGENSDRPRRDFSDRKPSGFGEERKPRADFRENSDRPRRDFSDRKPSGFGEERRGISNERPAFRDNSKPRFSDDRRTSSYPSNDRRSKFTSDDSSPRDNFSRPARRDFSDRKPSGFGEERKPRADFRENSDRPRRDFADRKPSGFGEERRGISNERPAFRDNSKPRFSDDRRTSSYPSNDRRSKFTSDDSSPRDNFSRPARRDFSDRKPSGFGEERKPRADFNSTFDSRGAKPRFGDNKSRGFGSQNRDEKRGEPRGEGRVGRVFSKDRNSDSGKKFGNSQGSKFGGKKFDNKNSNGGGRKPTKPNNR